MIKEAYCSFEVSKLLKEKGFNVECNTAYYNGSLIDYTMYGFCGALDFIFAPTQQMAMAWLREKQIYIRIIEDAFGKSYCFEVYPKNPNVKINYYVSNYYKDTYEDAVETALKYCLKNLI